MLFWHCFFVSSTEASIKADTKTVPSFADLENELGPSLLPGGHYVPKSCKYKKPRYFMSAF